MTDDDLIDTKGVTELLGLTSVDHVREKLVTRPDFPAPVINFSPRSRKWRRDEVQAWAATRQKRAAQPA